jgi:dihydrodipicolinate synthase/N-acetylneuraminate lyase
MKRRSFLAATAASAGLAAPAISSPQRGLTRERYHGVFAYPPTPFAGDLSLDETALRSNLRKLIRIGVSGIVMGGSTGEFYTLTEPDYRRLAEIMHEETRGTGVATVLGAAGLNPDEIIHRAHLAMEIGLDAVLAMQPFYYPLTKRELVAFWSQLCTACPDIGVIIYHFDWVRQEYTAETFRALAHLPNLIGSKEAHYNFQAWRALQKESPLVHMSATDAGWLVEMHRLGAPGVGSVSLSLMPHIIYRTLALCNQGKYTEAERAFAPFTDAVARLRGGSGRPYLAPAEMAGWQEYSGTARSKALTNVYGFLQVGPPRPPSIAVPKSMQKRLRDYLQMRYPELISPPEFEETVPQGVPMWPRRNV